MLNVTLKDGSVLQVESGITGLDLAGKLSQGLKKAALVMLVDGQVRSLFETIEKDAAVAFLTFEDEKGRAALRHTASHILAQAVKKLYPATKLAIGPSIENGFYYDFDAEKAFSPEDLKAIEKEMERIVKANHKLERYTLPRAQALQWADEANEPYKRELIEELPEDEEISFYKQGDFIDLCAGPHVPSTGRVKALKLTSAAGAYWRGSEKNKMLQRIYGTAFEKKQELEEYLARVEEAKKRDHNKLGREMEYFTTVDIIGQGLPIMLPKGAKVLQILQRFVEDEEERRGYLMTKTPFMAKSDLYKVSGHWDHYRDGMFVLGEEGKDDEVFALRPMTCPFQFQAYLTRTRSYRDLPIRYGETSTLFRNESSGEMHGLIRVRQFTISEGHLIVTPDQVEQEFRDVLDLANYMLESVGLKEDVSYRFSKWDPNNKDKYIGSPEAWENTQDLMRRILDHLELPYEEAEGEAAFYGPKLDIQIRNVHGKEDTLITVQIDFQLAERFGMTYVDADGEKRHPVVIHRTSLGCYERTLALLIEKFAGAFPTWLAPTQVRILTITDRAEDYARKLEATLRRAGVRVEGDYRNEKIGFKIREAQVEKIPYMLVLGDKEVEQDQVAVRSRKAGDLGVQSPQEFTAALLEEIALRKL